MVDVFLKLMNMSITATWIVLAVLLVRFFFPKAPKWIHCLLWGIVALRLLVPGSFESAFSLIPSAEVIPQDIAVSRTPAIYSGIPAVNSTVNPLFTLYLSQEEHQLEKLLSAASMVWLGGMAALLIYSVVTCMQLCWQIRVSVPVYKNVYICDEVDSPFVFGILRPRIYLPSDISEEQTQYVLSHEYAHIKRRDHWWKPLGFLLLTVYWFNPLLWLAYILLCRDIEQACDEKVIARMDTLGRKGYSEALIACSVHHRMIMACPIAFGEVSVKTRIRSVLNYKRPAFWITLASVAMCAAVAMCFLTNPIGCSHSYTGQVTLAPTCTHRGMQTNTCTLCEHSYTQSIELLDHSYDAGTVTLEPTCTELGSKVFTCTGCGIHKTAVLEKTAHIAGEPTACVEANCTEPGHRTATCTYCQTVYVTEVLPVNDVHELREETLRKPTCADPGEGIITCTRCDYQEGCTYEQQQPEHQYVKRLISESTCRENGVEKSTCTVCGDAYFTYLPKSQDHNWKVVSSHPPMCWDCGTINWGVSDYNLLDGTVGDLPSKPEDLYPVIRIWP